MPAARWRRTVRGILVFRNYSACCHCSGVYLKRVMDRSINMFAPAGVPDMRAVRVAFDASCFDSILSIQKFDSSFKNSS